MSNRIIGTFGGQKPGPLVIITAALHGNEPAGVQALEMAFQLLQDRQDLDFRGKFIGLIGNLNAYGSGKRFIDRDFNRIWHLEHLKNIQGQGAENLGAEDLEFILLYNSIREAIEQYHPDKILMLDLHTTSAGGGIFSIPTGETGEALAFAKALHAPVILNMFDRVDGTLLRFATAGHFSIGLKPVPTIGVAYEAGQHQEALSVSRSLSAIFNALRFAGCMTDQGLRSPDEMLLQKSFVELPRVTRLTHAHHIKAGDKFKMRPGYINFQAVKKGEHLANDIHGPIVATDNGLILMPLYQPQGSDGFFLVKAEAGH